MQSGFTQHSEQINAEASDWFTLMQSGSVSEQQRQQLEQWLLASDEHRDAYHQLDIIWSDLELLSKSREGPLFIQSIKVGYVEHFFSSLKQIVQNLLYLRVFSSYPKAAIVMSSLLIIASWVYVSQPTSSQVDLYSTKVGELKTIVLNDGSTVVLGAKSTIKTRFDERDRHIVLESGQAFFDVAKDSLRPFLLDAFDTRVKAVGTQFDVRNSQGRIKVAVLEGVVNVSSMTSGVNRLPLGRESPSIPGSILVLTAGQQVIKPRDGKFQPVKAATESEVAGWRNGRLSYRNANLVDVIGDANRYFEGKILLGSPELAKTKVTVAIQADRVEFLPELLSQTLPIIIDKKSNKKITISLK